VVRQIKEFRAEFQSAPFRELEILNGREIPVDDPWSDDGVAGGVAVAVP
jgi:hypothetical protein